MVRVLLSRLYCAARTHFPGYVIGTRISGGTVLSLRIRAVLIFFTSQMHRDINLLSLHAPVRRPPFSRVNYSLGASSTTLAKHSNCLCSVKYRRTTIVRVWSIQQELKDHMVGRSRVVYMRCDDRKVEWALPRILEVDAGFGQTSPLQRRLS
jgi:hypothetical protein